MPVLFLLPIRDPEPEGIEMIEAVSPRITPFQFRVRHAVADHGFWKLPRNRGVFLLPFCTACRWAGDRKPKGSVYLPVLWGCGRGMEKAGGKRSY